jgi:hypothetical protein
LPFFSNKICATVTITYVNILQERICEDSGADNTDIPIDGPPLEGDTSGAKPIHKTGWLD